MDSLYEALGAIPGDSQAELQRRYRQRARELHPDVNQDPGAQEAMLRLNQAWEVLGDPNARRRYDDQLLGPPEEAEATSAPGAEVMVPRPLRLLRPSVLIPLVLFLIFVGTAYAGRVGPEGPNPGPSPAPGVFSTSSATASSTRLVGRCVRRQTTTLTPVACSEVNDGQVVAEIGLYERCPGGTTEAALPGLARVACLKPVAP
ncbi:MAG: J domain-containing protein [Actinomycetota bacterium]|nr:J domain-containing protein [Actinomycetota bacterium]